MKHTAKPTWKSCLLSLGLLGLMSALLQPLPGGFFNNNTVSAQNLLPAIGTPIEGIAYAVTSTNTLISFNLATPSAIIRNIPITGLVAGDQITGIDNRATGILYAVSQTGRVYTINVVNALATAVSPTPFTPALAGTSFGVDFNQTVDRIRIVSNGGQNLRVNPNNGAVAGVDTNLAYAAGDAGAGATPNVVAAAYTANFLGATRTNLYGIDSNRDALVLQGSMGGAPVSPNTGQLTTVGLLGVDTGDQVGFDIATDGPTPGQAYATLTPQGGNSSLYTINLQTGAASLVGPVGTGNIIVNDIAVVLRVERIVGLTSGNNLINFSSGMPGTLASKVPVTGLIQGEALLGIEYRPSDQKIYGVTSISRMVTINPVTGAATPIGIQLNVPVFGLQTGLDVNPVVDRMRLVNSNRQNLRLNMSTGQIAGVDSPLIYVQGDPNAQATPNVVAAAYTNNIAGATSTSLYGIDVNLNTLVLQGSLGGTPISPNTGVMSTVGNLGVDAVGNIGFEIAPFTNAAFAAMTPNGSATSNLYTINLNTGVATMVGMIGGGETLTDITIVPRVESIYAVTASNRLISFNSTQPGVILSSVQISGLSGNAVGFDFRPANGQAYALDSNGRVYTVNLTTGAATAVGANPATTLAGTQFGVDFNAVPDRIRVVSNIGQDLRLNPNDGTLTATDGGLAYAATDVRATQPASVVAAAYNDSFAGTTSTTLYGLDSNYGTLVRQGSPGGAPVSPNLGTLFTIGSLGVTVDSIDSFDIANFTNRAYGSFTTGGISQLYRIDLITGAATLVGSIGGGEQIRGIAIVNAPSGVVQPVRTLAATNAASFSTGGVATSSLVSIFGQFLTNNGQTFIANSQPLPVSLGGVSVTVNGMNAQLLAVTPTQINLLMPATAVFGTAPQNLGTATMVVNNSDGSINMGTTALLRSAVGIFTANGSGSGTAAALTTTDGVTFQSTINPDGSARGISAGTAATPNFLVLYTTGISIAPAANPSDGNGVAEAVTVMIGNAPATVTFAGPAPGLSGVEQVNVMIPPQLAGAGTVPITMTVDGRISNLPTVLISQ